MPVPVDPAGRRGPTKAQAAGRGWRRTSKGLHVPAHVDGAVPEQRVVEQAARLPVGGAVTGWGALRLHGASYFDGLARDGATRRPVAVVVSAGGPRSEPGVLAVSREPLPEREVVLRCGVPVTDVRRALFDQMRRAESWREATVDMDMAAAAGLVSIRQMTEYLQLNRSWRRSGLVGPALRHADERSRSPNEVRTRLVWEIDAGLPRPLTNCEVFTLAGRLVAVVDLFDPVAGVVGEYDGANHLRTRRRSRDINREAALRDLGLEYFAVVRPDLADPAGLAARMQATRARAAFAPPAERRWTIVPPPGWPREESLDERLFQLEMARELQQELAAGRGF
jgi:hypothetical protein